MADSRDSASCSYIFIWEPYREMCHFLSTEKDKERNSFYWLDTVNLKGQRKKKKNKTTNNAHAAPKGLSQRHWEDLKFTDALP